MEDINNFLALLKKVNSTSNSSSSAPLTIAACPNILAEQEEPPFDFNLFVRHELQRVATLPEPNDCSEDVNYSR